MSDNRNIPVFLKEVKLYSQSVAPTDFVHVY